MWRQAWNLLPDALRRGLAPEQLSEAEEIRLRLGKHPYIVDAGGERVLSPIRVSSEHLESVLEKATDASMHTAIHALREGYLSYRGLRIGVCGVAAMDRGKLESYQVLSSLAIRIPRECRGICHALMQKAYTEGFQNTILLAPPGVGKTTALRDMIRELSGNGYRISVVDERNELAAMGNGTMSFDLGEHSDVLTGVPKAAAVMMMLRAMSPQILAMDEISSESDCAVARQTVGCGVKLLATAHASGLEDLQCRPIYRELLNDKVFKQALIIQLLNGKRSYRTERLPP